MVLFSVRKFAKKQKIKITVWNKNKIEYYPLGSNIIPCLEITSLKPILVTLPVKWKYPSVQWCFFFIWPKCKRWLSVSQGSSVDWESWMLYFLDVSHSLGWVFFQVWCLFSTMFFWVDIVIYYPEKESCKIINFDCI